MKVGRNFKVNDEVVFEEPGTEAICRVVGRREHSKMIFYDLLPFDIVYGKNRRKLAVGRVFEVGIRVDSVDKSFWGLRDA